MGRKRDKKQKQEKGVKGQAPAARGRGVGSDRRDRKAESAKNGKSPGAWRYIYNPEGDAADLLAYPSALVEGRIAGKYLLSTESLPDTVVVQGVKRMGILAGADVRVDRDLAEQNGVEVATRPRSGRGGAKLAETVSFNELVSASPKKFTAEEVDVEDPAVLLYTSGTTGKPKGVMLTHNNFHSECNDVVDHVFPMYPEDRIVAVLPLFHVYAMADTLVPMANYGCGLCLVPQYSPTELLRNIEETQATVLLAIPTMYNHMLLVAKRGKTTIPKSLRECISGGAPLPMKVLKEFEKVFETHIAEGYGLTESTSCVTLNVSGENYEPGSIGPPAPGVDMRIFDDNDQELPAGEVGELVIKGGVITKGYFNAPEATEEAFRNGWFHTGDMGYKNEKGYIFITDRKKDIIIRGGFNISPREVEEVIYGFPRVRDVAVVGVPDKSQREAVKAFVVMDEGENPTAKEIIDYCKEHLSPYKVPKFVEFRDALPKSATGKVLRKELKEGYRDERLIEKGAGEGGAAT